MPTTETFELVVLGKETVADDVVRLTLGRPDRGELPVWQPGAHLDLHLGEPPVIRQYSLCSSPTRRDHYQVAVLREPDSRGGSAYVHNRLSRGDTLQVSLPRNNFGQIGAKRYVFVAGGIGITPILPMIEAAQRAGADWTLLYGGRTAASMAFTTELLAAGQQRVCLRPQDEYGLLDLAGLLAEPTPDTAVYCCGPEPLLRAVEAHCASWPAGSLQVERFSPADETLDGPTTEFDVEFAQSGVTLTIPADRSIIEIADEAGIPVIYNCEEGTCGVCETPVLDGEPDHRDSVLTEQERQSGSCMMICVSRARSARLVLDA
ncbi:PDR/VanB family oxidoreductase [Amycolatopsis pithecellobii]|uniref:2Fe-2S iron-sulfur cluster binding domain-containing protein n=1 Tax=Amycolatopsis pithecellobii TaxID=664692 RepID=A0A6N7Z2H5_9PSEU|nr:PDR/VanB family oxidoreductase [Amycolatopsis pithecellobii]MTD52886.1 2Fe-2S iron-sulfur cluster binding domain-containing protein [Amycolatopsis pithecellobii]